MLKRFKRLFFIAFLSLFAFNAFTQIACTPTAGCAPLSGVAFTGVSGASGILWNFGDGVFANINNPTHTYTAPGSYTVTYTATVGGSPVTYTLLVKAFGKPTPNFSYTIPANHCAPMSVPFTDLSTGSAPITGWQWSYGDGGVGTTQNPTYVYTIPGTFNVTLIAKDANGCDSAMTKTAIIKVSAQPTVVISSNPLSLNSCTVPFTANFSGSASVSGAPGGGPLTYNWGFGNGNSSTVVSPPAQTYTANGLYTVTLTVTDNNNCSKTVTTPVSLVQPKVKAKLPDTVCYNARFIVQDTSAAGNTVWDWGDGSPTISNVPIDTVMHSYNIPGSHTITVTASIGSCVATKTFVIYVQKVIANFTATAPTFTCNKTFPVTFNSTSSVNSGGSLNYSWSYPVGGTATGPNPTFNITQGSLNPYTIYNWYKPRIHLTVTSSFGCKDTISFVYDSIRRITSYFYDDKDEGCVPLTVKFTDSSFSQAPLTTHDWNFGDGSTFSSPTATQVVHTYTAVGTYSVTEIIQNTNGCRDTSFIRWIKVSNPPTPTFSFFPSTVCPNQPVTIVNTTNPADSVNHWHISTDLGTFSGCITNPAPSATFNHTGVFGFTMTAYSHGCAATAVSPSSVTVKGPIASGRFFTNCTNPYDVTFHAYLQDCQSGLWDYGDGSPPQLLSGTGSFTTMHTYAASGNYTAVVTGINGTTGCPPFKDTVIVTVRKIKAIWSSNTGCNKIFNNYNASASQDVMKSCNTGFIWHFGNKPPIQTSSPSTSYSLSSGIYTVYLVVRDTNDCADTSKKVIKISQVAAAAAFSSTLGCLPNFVLNTTNNSTSDTSAISYQWNFGDGSAVVTSTNPTHTYTTATPPSQNFTVTMIATNGYGCTDTLRKVVTVNAPNPFISASASPSICVGTNLTLFANNSTGATSYSWNPGDGTGQTVTTTGSLGHTYTSSGTFPLTLVTNDAAGCKGNANYTVYVQNYPVPNFTFTSPSGSVACAGSTIIFQDNSTNPFPGPRNWDLASGGPVVGTQTVGTVYTNPGNYIVTLTVTSTYGCASTLKDTVHVYGASADFTLAPPVVCRGEAIKFTIKDTVGVSDWLWDFGDGTTNSTSVSPVTHTYNFHPPGGSTNVTLTYWASGHHCPSPATHSISIRQVIADFNRNNELALKDSVHCKGPADLFTSTSTSATAWSWNFGDGSTSAMTNPSHTYANPGTYTVTLAISDVQYGCKDTIRKKMVIIAAPQATVTSKDTCAGRPSQFSALGNGPGYTYVWHPGKNLNDSLIANPTATLNTPTDFTVHVTDPNGCQSDIVHNAYVQVPPPSVNWDTTIVIGQQVNIPGYAGSNFTYTWNPIATLSCSDCPVPISSTTVDITYTVAIKDNMGCFSTVNKFTVHVEPLSSVDVPTAFTPNGDGINDIIYVSGWGIKKLNYFRIYNRWGQLLFESNDITIGWDGTFNGVPQNMETYVYQVSVETYVDSGPKFKSSTFKLIR